MSDMLETARNALVPVVDAELGKHGHYYSLYVNEPEETIEIKGVPLTRVAGERYFVTGLKEVVDGTYVHMVPGRLARIRNWMDQKHSEHLA